MRLQGAFAIDVHLTGGHSWWLDLLGPLMLSLTAVAAAVIAARTANKRQEEQLVHDRDLQREQLAYDREQRNRQHVRDTIDDAVRQWDAAIRAVAEYESWVEKETHRLSLLEESEDEGLAEEALVKAKKSLLEELKEIGELRKKAQGLAVDLISTELRLILRLGEEHSIVEAHEAFRKAYVERKDLIKEVDLFVAIPEESKEALREANNASTSAASEFLQACEEWFEER